MPHVVVVEDTQLLGEMYQTSLQTAGIECSIASDGEKGLELIRSTLPDLVLLDLMIPKISGDEVLRQMREDDAVKHVKVIILTNISESEAPDSLKTLQFERYIVKANETLKGITAIVKETLQPQAA